MTRLRMIFAGMVALCACTSAMAMAAVLSAAVTYAAAGMMLTMLLAPKVSGRHPLILSLAMVSIYAGAVWTSGEVQSLKAVPILDIVVIVIVTAMGWAFTQQLAKIDVNLTRVLVGHAERTWVSFDQGRDEMYRELRRAREHDRTLTVVSLALPGMTPQDQATISHLINREVVQRFAQRTVAQAFRNDLSECDTIAAQGNELILLLTETDAMHAAEIVGKAQEELKAKLGIEVDAGLANFPDDEVTFVGLVEQATARRREPQPTPEEFVNSVG